MNRDELMLDFGCGDGGFDEILPDRISCGSWLSLFGGENAVGLDIEPTEIERAKKNIKNGTKFIVTDGGRLPFDDGHFSTVHIFGTLHHTAGYQPALAELARVTRQGGAIRITESVDNYFFFKVARRLLGQWQGHKITDYFTALQLVSEIEKYFEIETIKYCFRPVTADLLRLFGLEPHVSLKLLNTISEKLQFYGYGELFCSQVYIYGLKR